mmetsp:Transcript_6716/g.18972  ORF Transcript_6716/g.18972 Transcript_6716/m.18972 type:complete len:437 (+) Transcript_6716:126-1436(+)
MSDRNKITVTIHAGKDLIAMDTTGKSDPYIVVRVLKNEEKPKTIYTTEIINQTLNPTWNENLSIKQSSLSGAHTLRFSIYDKDVLSDDFMGNVNIPVNRIQGENIDEWFTVEPKEGKKASKVSGTVHIISDCGEESNLGQTLYERGLKKFTSGEKAEGLKLLEEAANKGNLNAQRDYAKCLQIGVQGVPDPIQARRFYTQAAKNGCPYAENNLGSMCQSGDGGVQNFREAREHYENAASTEIPAALFNLGVAHYAGIGGAQNFKKAREFFDMASFASYPPAQNNLAFCFQFGIGGEKNLKEALSLYKKAASAGYPDAMVNLGQCKQFGVGGEKDEQEAFQLYTKASQAGNKEALFCLAYCYECGIGVAQDKSQARAVLSREELSNDVEAEQALHFLDQGNKLSTGREKKKSKSKKGHKRNRSMDKFKKDKVQVGGE